MKIIAFAIVTAIAAIACAMGQKKPTAIAPIQGFELNRYLGDWYEIGSIPQRFSKGCVCTKATYTAREDGQIDVLNQCRDQTPSGELKKAKAVGRFATSDKSLGHLEVNFTPFPFLWADYVIQELDHEYEYATVTNFKGTAFWILARRPEMDEHKIVDILARAKTVGVQTELFTKTLQKGCRPFYKSNKFNGTNDLETGVGFVTIIN